MATQRSGLSELAKLQVDTNGNLLITDAGAYYSATNVNDTFQEVGGRLDNPTVPANSSGNVSRWVMDTADGTSGDAGYWARLATFDGDAGVNNRYVAVYELISSYFSSAGTGPTVAKIFVTVYDSVSGLDSLSSIEIHTLTGPALSADSFRLVQQTATRGDPVQLWMRKDVTFEKFSLVEVTSQDYFNSVVVSYNDNAAWQLSTPTGAVVITSVASLAFQFFNEVRSTAAPNDTVPVHQWIVTGTETDIDIALSPKGTGALLASLPDGAATGGNKRGNYAVDLQTFRNAATQVASGWYSSLTGGAGNVASGLYSVVSGGITNTSNALHSVVGGGQSNTASGESSTVAGGTTNGASALGCTVGGGSSNTASLNYSTVAGGLVNVASGSSSFIGGGTLNTASGGTCVIGGGSANTASALYGTIPGGYNGTTRGLVGRYSYSTGLFSVAGDAQIGTHILMRTTTDATPGIANVNQIGVNTTTVPVLPDNHAYTVVVYVTARDTATGDMASFKIEGSAKRGAGAATTVIVGTPTVTTIAADAGAATWSVALVANTTRGSVEVEVTGEAATTIHWVCKVNTIEVG